MRDAFAKRLAATAKISASEKAALIALASEPKELPKYRKIELYYPTSPRFHVLTSGWAAQFRTVSSGARQMTGMLLPGDMIDYDFHLLGEVDYGVASLTPVTVSSFQLSEFDELCREHPAIDFAFKKSMALALSSMRSWLANLGRCDAQQRIAYLICELHERLTSIGLCRGTSFDFPLTQEDVGDAAGLTAVHTNRKVKALREAHLIDWSNRRIEILDLDLLRRVAEFQSGGPNQTIAA